MNSFDWIAGAAILYRFADIAISSSRELAELPGTGRADETAAEIEIIFSPEGAQRPARPEGADNTANPEVTLSGTAIELAFPRQGVFVFDGASGQLTIHPAPGARDETVIHLLIDQVLPRILAHRGRLVVHGGAVRLGVREIALIADSGTGKSTLTGALLRAGHHVLSDDAIVVEGSADDGFKLIPTYPSLRLMPDSLGALFPGRSGLAPVSQFTAKNRIALPLAETGRRAPDAPANAKPALAAIYVLERRRGASDAGGPPQAAGTDEGGITFTPIDPGRACIEIINQAFQLDIDDRAAVGRTFRHASALASAVPVFRLGYPSDLDGIDALARRLARHALDAI